MKTIILKGNLNENVFKVELIFLIVIFFVSKTNAVSLTKEKSSFTFPGENPPSNVPDPVVSESSLLPVSPIVFLEDAAPSDGLQPRIALNPPQLQQEQYPPQVFDPVPIQIGINEGQPQILAEPSIITSGDSIITDSMNNDGLLTRQGTTPPVVTCICVPPGQCTGSFDGTGQIDIRIVNNAPTTTTAPPPSTTCGYGLVRCCMNGPYRCGSRYVPIPGARAPGVGQAPFGAYPWQAAILTTNNVYLGSGALIDRNHILTAAHKIYNLTTTAYKVRLGEWDSATLTEPIPAEDYTVTRATVHPNFNSNNLLNDIAILRLSRDVNLGAVPTIATVCLMGAQSLTGQRCYVSGWGKDDFGGQYQPIQKEVDVPIRAQADCQNILRGTRLGANFVFNTESFMCAGGEAGKDACTGDGGSPLVCFLNGQWFAVGLVAWGIGCATGNVPGVYVNLASYLSWIQTTASTT